MGILLSCCEGNEEVCRTCQSGGLALVNDECPSCRIKRTLQAERIVIERLSRQIYQPLPIPRDSKKDEPKRPLFGEFRCTCRRRWNSRRAWRGIYQICKSCQRHVHAHTFRELRAEDIEGRSLARAKQDHPTELCQMCTQLGYYCGRYNP